MHTYSREYKQAFERYLRKGVPPEISVKGPRDILDVLLREVESEMRRELSSASQWTTYHMSLHFYLNGGRAVTLQEMGHLEAVKNEYESRYLQNFTQQIAEKARSLPNGNIVDDFSRGYEFGAVAWAHGGSRMDGTYQGTIYYGSDGKRYTSGTAHFAFSDRFADPLDVRSILAGLVDLPRKIEDFFTGQSEIEEFREEDLLEVILQNFEFGGDPYYITGGWKSNIQLLL